ncbi:anaerobic ribonucleoside-triphosphate reductase activating protein [Terrisporobacter vanillatitrophus]|uniref:anaerobic ribonucleoside-triphosphate reductase activating protein n=1 Tax=Terrisporobacter vanillatitrophus TaxID=3058402 RepID=UPI0033688EB5
MKLRLASQLTYDSIVDGPGLRMVIWTQGCIHHCYKCHNPQTHKLEGGIIVDTDYVIEEIKKLKLHRGITLSGGEPFLQPKALSLIAKYAQLESLDVWCYTGFEFEYLISKNNPLYMYNKTLLQYIDILVDGKFVYEKKDIGLKFRGSSNQRIIDVKSSLKINEIVLKEEYMEKSLHMAK